MNKLFLALCLCSVACLASCSEKKPPTNAHVAYTVSYQGSTSNIAFDGEFPREVNGSCRITDSSDTTYPFLLNFHFSKEVPDHQYIEVYALKMRAGLSTEILLCDGLSINYGEVTQQAPLVECGDTESGKCAFTSVSFDEQQNLVTGSFGCGEFTTNTLVTMEITGGSFSMKNCQR